MSALSLPRTTVLVAGLGNIGSTLPGLLLQAGFGGLRLVDRDRAEEKNLIAQDYRPEDVGRLKAEVIAERQRLRFPGLSIEAWPADLEDLPARAACVDLVLGALDSRRARQVLVSELAWPLGVPVIDGGVGDGRIGRVQVFRPSAAAACLECTWGAADYRLAAAEYPCVPGGPSQVAPTGAPAYLGGFTASVMVNEALRLLESAPGESYEIVFDLNHLALRRFALKRDSRCRFDHKIRGEPCDPNETARTRRSSPWGPSTI
jgi:molybdopterin/thiamine biosynthesis adenylyltransferase